MHLDTYTSVHFSQQSAKPACFPCAIPATQLLRPMLRRAASAQCSMRRQQVRGFRALSASAVGEKVPSNADSRNQQLLATLTGFSISELRQHMHEHPDDVSLSFLQWLASREDQLQGNAKMRLTVLAGQLLALREGLDPSGFDDVADELQKQWSSLQLPGQQQHHSSSQQQQQTPQQGQQQSCNEAGVKAPSTSEETSPGVFPSTPSSLQQSLVSQGAEHAAALNAFTQANITRQYQQVKLLNRDVQQARAQSTVQLIGRKQISASDLPPVEGAAQRILEYLLALPTAALRREVLPEAFQPDDSGVTEEQYGSSPEGSDAATEQLSTTPLQLLQAVDLELARIAKQSSTGAEGSKLLLPAGDSPIGNVQEDLHQLRVDVLALWDAS